MNVELNNNSSKAVQSQTNQPKYKQPLNNGQLYY